MVVKPYESSGDSKKAQIEQMFDNIAPNYDLLNKVLSLGIDRRWRKKLITQLQAHRPTSVLDIATGTGDVVFGINKNMNVEKLVGLDLSKEMLEVAKDKLKKLDNPDHIGFIKGDSENLPFEENSFDAITASFGVRNFENLQAGIAEMYRTLKPNGVLKILEFTRPRSFPFKHLFNAYFKNFLPVIGKFKSKDDKAYQYLYESVQAFPDFEDFVSILKNEGFKECKYESLTFGICAIYTGVKS